MPDRMEALLNKMTISTRQLAYMLAAYIYPHKRHSSARDPPSQDATVQPTSDSGLRGDALTLAGQLNGKTLHVPDLMKVFADWPSATNKHLDRLQGLVDAILERVITHKKKLKALKAANFAYLIALWYPDAEWEELEVATAYSVWIFVWDDEVDAGDTDVSSDEDKARAYGQQSLKYIREVLDLVPGLSGHEKLNNEAPNPNMVLFNDVGRGLLDATDSIQRQRFYRELENFMLQVGIEHGYRLKGSIPTVEKYLEIRSGSVGCAPQIALTEHMLKIRLPESIMETGAMKSLWRETVIICLILNDIYSVQKEITQDSFFNLVPVIYKNLDAREQKLDNVTDEFMRQLHEAMNNLETAAASLDKMTANNVQVNKDTQAFVEWSRYFSTGVLVWSLESRRYGMAKCANEDGSLSIVL